MNQVVIIGAGAAGLMVAVQCCLRGIKPVLFDSQKKIGKKILISGGGRCNVTNGDVSEKHFNGGSSHLVRHILNQFDQNDTIRFFENLGVPLKLEMEFQKYFPISDKASDILNSFTSKLEIEGVRIQTDKKLVSIQYLEDHFLCNFSDKTSVESKIVIMATGGLSVPQTGSDGSGFEVLKKLGHSITKLYPALAPLNSEHKLLRELKGYSSVVELSLFIENKKKVSFVGPMLFTHFGFSGPVVLNISRHYFFNSHEKVLMKANWLPALSESDLIAELLDPINGKQNLSTLLRKYLSKNLVELLFAEAEVPASTRLSELSKVMRKKILDSLYRYELIVSGSRGFAVAEATAGGISIGEVQHGTLESKLFKNLFFCGEMIDVDGQLGGYNFQWAFASANTVANAVLKACRNLNSH